MVSPALVVADIMMHACRVRSPRRWVIERGMGGIVGLKSSTCPIRPAPPSPNRSRSQWIPKVCRVIPHVVVKVYANLELLWIFTEKSSDTLIVVTGAVFIDSSFGVKLSRSVPEWVREGTSGCGQLAVGVVRISIGQHSGRTTQ